MIKRFLPERRRFGILPFVLLFIYGIPGHIDDGLTWMGWIQIASWQLLEYLLIFLVGALSLYAVVPQRVLNWFMNHRDQAESHQQAESHPQAESDEPKIYTVRTAAEIFSAVENLTGIEIEKFAQPHLGKWIRVQSVVKDIYPGENDFHVLIGEGFLTVSLKFAKEKWPSIETMTKGDRLAAEGKITKIRSATISLDCCEMVELQDEDDSLRQDQEDAKGRDRITPLPPIRRRP